MAPGQESLAATFHLVPDRPAAERPRGLYRDVCPGTGAGVQLPRTAAAEALAGQLVESFQPGQEGKMLGVLLVEDAAGRIGYGRAFSGLLHGCSTVAGWVSPLHLPRQTPSQPETMRQLELWKRRLQTISGQLEGHPFPALQREWAAGRELLRCRHLQGRKQRLASSSCAAELQRQARRDSLELRDFKREQRAALARLEEEYRALELSLREGKQERRQLSRQLQTEMHEQFGDSLAALLGCPLADLFPAGPPTGAGDCCAPKLLAWAARNDLRPLAMAEIWCGPSNAAGRRHGEFYGPCQERCGPLMGPLLTAALRTRMRTLHHDERLIVVDKPAGLLSVPGRHPWAQDSVLSRLQKRWPEVLPVHRLDQDTSGLLLFARDANAQGALQRQFQERRVRKVYQALLSSLPDPPQGRLDLALAPDPDHPGCYRIEPGGKSALTYYRILDAETARVELRPLSGRSHQLRVHMAQGLHCPIRGDRLYGAAGERPDRAAGERLMLHASELAIAHPEDGRRRTFSSPGP